MSESDNCSGFMYTWKIKNFPSCCLKDGQCLKSSLFRIEMLANSEWQLYLYPRKNNDIILNLCRAKNDEGPEELNVNFILSILKKNCPSLFIQKYTVKFERNVVLSEPLTVPIKEVYNEKHLFIPEDTLVVQCHLWTTTTKDFVKCSALTVISGENHHFSLPLSYFSDNIFLCQNEVSLKSVSKKFPDFMIYCTKQQENVNIKIHITETGCRVFVRCEIFIREENDSKKLLFDGDHWFESEPANKTWTLSDIFQSVLSDIKCSRDKSYIIDINLYVSDGCQNVFIEKIAYNSIKTDSRETIETNSDCLLRKQLEKLYVEEILYDFTIKSNDKEFKIHKTLFAAASPVFRAMFELNMSEKENSIVSIKDIDCDTLGKLISYVYTDKVPDLEWDIIIKLYAAADKYQIMDLKQKCARIIKIKLTLENVLDALTMANLHEDKLLKTFSKNFIQENSEKVLHSEKWKCFMKDNANLACEAMYEICIPFIKSI